MLSGYKTYIVALVAIVSAVGSFLAGDIMITDLAHLVLTAVLGMTIRHGIATANA